HDHAIDAARDDEIEIGEICRDVEREPVPRNPVAGVNTDGRDLLSSGPDAGESGVALTRDSVVGQRIDQRLFDLPQVPMQVLTVPFQIDDRIADELTRSVK